ncbi:MAG: shikimate dehydrogenase [Bacillota bacterium]|jgi:shikimate dehydrogenase
MKTIINAKTSICALFGDPVAHSLSPAMHNAAFQTLEYNSVYVACRVPAVQIPAAVMAIRALGIKGVNVTIPHKQAVAAGLDEVCGDARLSGSVNTIINRDGRLVGMSTDGIGFVRSLQEEGAFAPAGKRVLLLGAGGAALAVIYRLLATGITALTLVNRDHAKALCLRDKILGDTGFAPTVAPLEQLSHLNPHHFDLLVNTTSVGLHEDVSLLESHWLHPQLFVYDLVYKPGGTKLVRQAARAGCRYLSGLSLLLYQGAESFRLWFEVDPPLAAMRAALETACRERLG